MGDEPEGVGLYGGLLYAGEEGVVGDGVYEGAGVVGDDPDDGVVGEEPELGVGLYGGLVYAGEDGVVGEEPEEGGVGLL